ncbi:hypothetical protein E2542_SST13456 [Spatholobus suberectus]|nr:hypothetical protein E2542_SST13456 [Spatholobus suberectus]
MCKADLPGQKEEEVRARSEDGRVLRIRGEANNEKLMRIRLIHGTVWSIAPATPSETTTWLICVLSYFHKLLMPMHAMFAFTQGFVQIDGMIPTYLVTAPIEHVTQLF